MSRIVFYECDWCEARASEEIVEQNDSGWEDCREFGEHICPDCEKARKAALEKVRAERKAAVKG